MVIKGWVRYCQDNTPAGQHPDTATLELDLSPASLAGQWHLLKYAWEKTFAQIPKPLRVERNPFRGRAAEISWKEVDLKTWHELSCPWDADGQSLQVGTGLAPRPKTQSKRRDLLAEKKQAPLRLAPEPFPR